MSVSAALKDAYALGLGADHIINNWGFDENLVKLGGPAAEGAMGLIACALFIDEYPAKANKVVAYAKKLNPGVPLENRLIRTVQGWVKVTLAVEAMKMADKAGKLNGPGIKDAFETFRNWPGLKEFGGQLVTISPTDHRYSSIVRVGRGRQTRPDDRLELLPMSDGGDGFGEIVSHSLDAEPQQVRTIDAAHRPCTTTWWWHVPTQTAIVESARVIGLAQWPPGKYHPFELDTAGLGELFQAATTRWEPAPV